MKIKFNHLNKIVGAMLLVILCIPCSYASLDEESLSKLRAGGAVVLGGAAFFSRGKLVGDEEAKEIADILKESSSIITLDLYGNQIGAIGALAIAKALETNAALTTLNLNWNKIGDVGAQVLAKALKTNTALTVLNLCENQISDKGAQEIADALKTNTVLIKLDLVANRIGGAGAQALVDAIIQNLILEDVRIGGVSSSQHKILQSVCARNKLIAKIMARIKRKVWYTLSLGRDARVGVNSPLQLLDFGHIMPAIMERVDVRDYYNERVLHTIMHGTLEEVQQLLATDARDPAFAEAIEAINLIRELQIRIYKLIDCPLPIAAAAAAAAQQPVPQRPQVTQMEAETQTNLTSADIERLLQLQGQISQLAAQSRVLS